MNEIKTDALDKMLKVKLIWKLDHKHHTPISSPEVNIASTRDSMQFCLYTSHGGGIRLSMKLNTRRGDDKETVEAHIKGSLVYVPATVDEKREVIVDDALHRLEACQFVTIVNKPQSEQYNCKWESLAISLVITFMPSGSRQTADIGGIVEDFQRFYQSEIEKDLEITCKDGEVVETNKVLLMMRSDVFKAMLTAEMSEKLTNKLSMTEYDKSTISSFTTFLMTDKVVNIADHATDLYVLADKYKVPKLQMICEEYIAENVTHSNVSRITTLVHQIPSSVITKALIGVLNRIC